MKRILKYLIILNPISGSRKRREAIVDMIDREMRKSDHYYEYAFTSKPGDAKNLAIQGGLEGFDIMIAAGGDGTINEVATGLINKPSSLGIIPLGSGNGIARSLNLPLDLKGSIEFLLNPTITKIDVGRFNNRYFIGVCGIGFDAQIGKRFQNFGVRGPLPYFIIGIQEFLIYRPEVYLLKFNGMEMEIKAQLIAIANTKQYGNGAIIAPDADPKDGYLDLCILKSIPVWQAFDVSYKLFTGKIYKSAQYDHYKCKSIYIQSHTDHGHIHADGEPFKRDKEISVEIINKALSVCTPM